MTYGITHYNQKLIDDLEEAMTEADDGYEFHANDIVRKILWSCKEDIKEHEAGLVHEDQATVLRNYAKAHETLFQHGDRLTAKIENLVNEWNDKHGEQI